MSDRSKRFWRRAAEAGLVVAILAVTLATWLPALIGTSPNPAARIQEERRIEMQRAQQLPGNIPPPPPPATK